jgi:hypothetical protein
LGVVKDLGKAVELAKLALNDSELWVSPFGAYTLGLCYVNGFGGVDPNVVKGQILIQEAALSNIEPAKYINVLLLYDLALRSRRFQRDDRFANVAFWIHKFDPVTEREELKMLLVELFEKSPMVLQALYDYFKSYFSEGAKTEKIMELILKELARKMSANRDISQKYLPIFRNLFQQLKKDGYSKVSFEKVLRDYSI